MVSAEEIVKRLDDVREEILEVDCRDSSAFEGVRIAIDRRLREIQRMVAAHHDATTKGWVS